MVLNTAVMKKLNWKTRGVIYKLVIFMQKGAGVVEEKHHWNIISVLVLFLTEVLSSEVECDWKFSDWYRWLVLFWILFNIFQYIIFFLYFWCSILGYACIHYLILHFVNTILYLNWYVIIIELISVSIENSRYNDIHIYVCFDLICIFAMISFWNIIFYSSI